MRTPLPLKLAWLEQAKGLGIQDYRAVKLEAVKRDSGIETWRHNKVGCE
jgi:hypothetical protein